uniref:DNA-directed DNA polymerase n=1 Tax=Parascaris univalens TaxID=6257 RepID=A0A915ANL5_PARUN
GKCFQMLNKSRRLLLLMRYTYRGDRFTSTFIKQGRSQTPESLSSTHEISSSTLNDATSQSSLKQIALVPARIHRHLFGDGPIPMNVSNDIYENLDLPKLYSEDLQKHFYKLGEMQIHDYRKQLELAATMQPIPEMPKQWLFESGWTKYSSNIGNYEKVEYPDESLLFFDVEVCLNDGQLPTLAIALSPTNWYSWCSDRLVHNTPVPDLCRLHHLIPLERSGGSNRAAIVIGHNVAYDRSRVREQYLRNQTGTRFWDTMSMAIPIYGMADHQLLLYEKNDLEEDERGHNGWIDDWKARVSKNSLAALHEKLCSHKSKLTVNKSMQSFFVNEPIDEIRDNFQDLVQYCAEDVLACLELYQALYPEFVKRFPHPITWQGMLEMSAVYLPITSNWRYFYRNCEEEASNENRQAAQDVIRAARHLTNTLEENQRFKEDAWMWQEDWSKRNCTMPTWYTTLLR